MKSLGKTHNGRINFLVPLVIYHFDCKESLKHKELRYPNIPEEVNWHFCLFFKPWILILVFASRPFTLLHLHRYFCWPYIVLWETFWWISCYWKGINGKIDSIDFFCHSDVLHYRYLGRSQVNTIAPDHLHKGIHHKTRGYSICLLGWVVTKSLLSCILSFWHLVSIGCPLSDNF